MLGNGEIAEELLTVSEVAAALKVPVSWVYERTRRSGTDQETLRHRGLDLDMD